MLNVRFRDKAIIDLQVFIRNYEESFLHLYNDSGIWSENTIKDIYIKSALELYERIRDNIVLKLSKKRVLGRKKHELMIEIDFYVGSRLVIVLFSDDRANNIRWIESIFIDRKPIIF